MRRFRLGRRKHEEAAELIRRNVGRGSRAAKAPLKAAAAPGGAWPKIRPLPAFAAALLLASLAAGCSGGGTSQPSGNGAEAGVSAPAAGSESAKPGGAAASGGAAGGSAGEAKTVSAEPDEQPGTVYYEIFVRSFYDSDGDGIGDLNGVTEKLDDLNDGDPSTGDDLGIGGIWLMPILESPSYHGYDVTDYDRVNPDYGTEADLQRLVDEAHKRGIKVIMDLVVNHTGSGHPWFKDSASGPGAAHRDWYVWAEDAGIEPSGQSAAGSGSPWHAKNGSHYMGTFWGEMPDLNFDNPEVRAEMIRIGRRWLDLGLDGFRLDAAKHIYEDRTEDRGPETTKKNVQWWQEFRSALQASNPDVYLVGEIWENSPAAVAPYLDNAFDSGFNFGLAEGLVGAAKSGHAGSAFSRLPDYYRLFGEASGGQFVDAGFLTNHDQDRVMTQLGGRLDAMKTAAAMLLTLPGNPFIYYGEEIGMLGAKPDEQIREPMLWAAPGEDPGQTTWEPLIANAKAADSRSGSGTSGGAAGSSAAAKPTGPDAGAATVAAQTGDPDSLLSRYRTLIRWRDEIPALGSGALEAYDPGDDRAAGWIRTSKGQRVLVLHNLSGEPLELAVSRPAEAAPAAPGGEAEFGRLLRATDPAAGLDPAGERLILPPHASAVLGR